MTPTADPAPVIVENPEPLPVAVVGNLDLDSQAQSDERARASQGWRDADAVGTAGQRRINLIWELTQSAIALLVVGLTAVGVFVARIVIGQPAAQPFPPEWWTIVGLVIGFYFSRTNHTKVGGVPPDQTGR